MRVLMMCLFLGLTIPAVATSQKSTYQYPKNPPQVVTVRTQILKNNPKLPKNYAQKLATAIVAKSEKHGLKPRLLAAILMQESRYSMDAVNRKTKDFGIAQINFKTIAGFGFDQNRLMTDLDYAVEAGAIVLASYKRYAKREPKTWYSRYNCGTRSLDVVGGICDDYKSRVERYL